MSIILLVISGASCGFIKKHPTQAKIYMLVGGAAIGTTVGLHTRLQFCHYAYEGQPYYGTTCPKPAGLK